MEKPTSISDSGGTTTYNTVFIDTSLDTHLAMIVSGSDTVSDLKRRILHEYPLCFPNISGIKIHALKVKRKGHFYHLSDSMFVKSAFDGVSKSWFLSVDASIVEEQSENQHTGKSNFGHLGASCGITGNPSADGVALLADASPRRLSNIDDSTLTQVHRDQNGKQKPSTQSTCNILALDNNNRSDMKLKEKRSSKDSITCTECKENNFRNGINDVQFNAMEGAPETVSVTKKKPKAKRRREDEVSDHISNEENVPAHVSDEDESQQDMVLDNSLVTDGRGTVVTRDMQMGSKYNADEHCRISASDINQKSGRELLMTDVLYEGTAASGKNFECDTSKNVDVNAKCNTSLEEASPRPAANKKQKTARKDEIGNSSKENRLLACDSTRETLVPEITISQCSFGNKQKGTNTTLDHLSSEMSKDDNLLTTDASSGRKKRKKKSSKFLDQVVAAVPSSAQDERRVHPGDTVGVHHRNLENEHDAAVLPSQSVHGATISEPYSVPLKKNLYVPLQEEGENNKVPCSLEVDTSGKGVGNVESKNVSPELTAPSAAKQMRISVDHHVGEAEGNPPLPVQEASSLNKNSGVTKCENVIVHDCQKFGGDQTGRVAEGKELSQSKDSEAMPPVKVTPSGSDEVVVASNLVDANGNVDRDTNVKLEPPKSSKKKRKSKKSQDPSSSVTKHKTGSGIGISSTEPHETIHTDHSSDKSKKEESFMSPVKGKEIPKMTAVNNSVLANDMDSDNVIRNVLESLKDISEIPMNAENKDEKSRKKTKRKRNSAAKNPPELLEEDENVSCKNVTLSTDGTRDAKVDASLKLTKKASLVKTSSENKLNGSNLESENNTGIETSPLQDQNGNFPTSGRSNEANNKMEASCESDRTIVNDNFVPNQQQHLIDVSHNMPVQKVTEKKGVEKEVKASKKKKKLDAHSNGPSPDLQNTLKLFENQRSGGKVQAVDSSSVEPQRSLSKGEGDNPKIHPKTKLARVSGSEAKNNSGKLSKKEEATRPNAVNGSATHTRSDKSKQNIAASDSSLSSSKNILPEGQRGDRHQFRLDVGDVSSKYYNGEVVYSSQHKKSLLATSGSIFKEDSYESSDDEDGVYNSDASTRTPSDNSLSSDYSDGDSGAQQNGTSGSKRKESGGRNITNSFSSGTLEKILRSSSSYKAAKLNASQSQMQNTENQPLEFVPDSQADQQSAPAC
ncbi:uncharacterized protein LOC116128265 [Pistacia vera]|uniref:uncharacterized protein LOC116128265 n=1 Tax=Pistacia vera TaxID=55513 RepID=UPI0012633722|nr:uncharacterized protein LOC116128265 [Pistacia vera]